MILIGTTAEDFAGAFFFLKSSRIKDTLRFSDQKSLVKTLPRYVPIKITRNPT